MATVVVELTGDEAKLVASMRKVLEQQQKMTPEAVKLNQETKKQEAEQAKVAKLYTEQVSKLQLQEVALRKGNAAANEMRNIQQGLTKDQAASIRKREEELVVLAKSKSSFAGIGKAAGDALAPGLFASAASGVGVITMAIGAGTAAWREYKNAQKDALASLQQNADADRRLSQVATSGEDLATLQKTADDAAKISGVDRQTARAVLFTARSEGFEKDYTEIMRASPVVNPESAASAAGQLPTLFKGSVTPLQAVSGALVGAKNSRLNFEQLSTGLPSAAEGASMAGSSFAETVAAQAVLASRFKSGDVAADRIKAFGTGIAIDKGAVDKDGKETRPSLAGKGVVGATEALIAMTAEQRNEFLGESQELNVAFNVMKEELAKIKEQRALIEVDLGKTAGGAGLLRDSTAVAMANPAISTRIGVNASSIEATIAQENALSKGGAKSAVGENKLKTSINADGVGLVDRSIANSLSAVGFTDAAIQMGADPTTVAQSTISAARGVNALLLPGAAGGSVASRARRAAQFGIDSTNDPSTANVDQKRQADAIEKQNAMMAEQTKILQRIAEGPGARNTAPAIRAQISNPPVLGAN